MRWAVIGLMQSCSARTHRVNGPDESECALLPTDEEGNQKRLIRSVRQDAQDYRRWPL